MNYFEALATLSWLLFYSSREEFVEMKREVPELSPMQARGRPWRELPLCRSQAAAGANQAVSGAGIKRIHSGYSFESK